MTLLSGEKYSENKWKNGCSGDYSGSTKRLPILSLTSSMFLLLAVVLIVVLKFLAVLTGKPAALLLIESGIFTLEKVQLLPNLLWPSIKGLSWTIFSWMLLYLDSSEPGTNPPATLAPRKTRLGNYGTERFHHIGYLTSLATGLVVFSMNLLIL